MKKSKIVKFGLLNGLILTIATACGPSAAPVVVERPIDPCAQASFDQIACSAAISAHGYYYAGVWHPVLYPYPVSYYYGIHTTYIRSGGTIIRTSPGVYSRTYVAPRTTITRSGNTVGGRVGATSSRGGFGSTGGARGGFSVGG